MTRPLTRTAPLRLLLARRAVRALLCLGLALAAPAGAAQEAEQASPEGTAGDASDAAQPAAATPPAALPRLPPPAPPVPRLPGDAGLLATWLDEPAPGLWQPSQPAQRGVLVVLERSATGARASLALRDSLARSGFASFLALSEAPEVNDLPALLTGLRARAAGTPLVLYVAGDLAARVLPVANELPLDGIVLQDVPGHLGEVAVRAAGQLDASDGPSAALPALLAITRDTLLLQQRRPPWWRARGELPPNQEWRLVPARRSPVWLARAIRGWLERRPQRQAAADARAAAVRLGGG